MIRSGVRPSRLVREKWKLSFSALGTGRAASAGFDRLCHVGRHPLVGGRIELRPDLHDAAGRYCQEPAEQRAHGVRRSAVVADRGFVRVGALVVLQRHDVVGERERLVVEDILGR